MDVRAHNRDAWDRKVTEGCRWTVPVSSEVVAAARRGQWSIILTPTVPVPTDWLGEVQGRDVLALGGGGGQQAPVLAAAGARVTVLDNSPAQLQRDREVAEREGLNLTLVEGDMADLGAFPAGSFDLIVNPVSMCFVPDVHPVWREAFRVLRPEGRLLCGQMNPAFYVFDFELAEKGQLEVAHRLPYADVTDMDPAVRAKHLADGEALEWSHTLNDLIGGQCAAGFLLTGLYEDRFAPETEDRLSWHMPTLLATCAVKPEPRS